MLSLLLILLEVVFINTWVKVPIVVYFLGVVLSTGLATRSSGAAASSLPSN